MKTIDDAIFMKETFLAFLATSKSKEKSIFYYRINDHGPIKMIIQVGKLYRDECNGSPLVHLLVILPIKTINSLPKQYSNVEPIQLEYDESGINFFIIFMKTLANDKCDRYSIGDSY